MLIQYAPLWDVWRSCLMSADSPGQASKMAYLHRKRLNFIQKGQNESRYPQVDIKTGIFA